MIGKIVVIKSLGSEKSAFLRVDWDVMREFVIRQKRRLVDELSLFASQSSANIETVVLIE